MDTVRRKWKWFLIPGRGYQGTYNACICAPLPWPTSQNINYLLQGIRDVIAVDELFDAIPAINRSFHHVKNVSKTPNEHGPDFIEFREFRLFLQTLRQYFEYYQAFDRSVSLMTVSLLYLVLLPGWTVATTGGWTRRSSPPRA